MQITGAFSSKPIEKTGPRSNVKQYPGSFISIQEDANTGRMLNKKTSINETSTTESKLNRYSTIWEKLSNQYNIRDASYDEFCDIAYQLYDAKQVSPQDYVKMIFDPSKSPQSVKSDIFLTPVHGDGRRDWIAEFEARASLDLKIGNDLGFKNNNNIVDLLKQLLCKTDFSC